MVELTHQSRFVPVQIRNGKTVGQLVANHQHKLSVVRLHPSCVYLSYLWNAATKPLQCTLLGFSIDPTTFHAHTHTVAARDPACGKKMSVFAVLFSAFLIACTVALMRTLNWFRRPTIAQANVLTGKHKSKCGGRTSGSYRVAIVGAGKWTPVRSSAFIASMCCATTSPSCLWFWCTT